MNLKKYIIIIILTVFLFSIAGVSASDTNETVMTSIKETPIEINEINEPEIEQNNEVLTAREPGFDDLQSEINGAQGFLVLKENYKYKSTGYRDVIEISKDGFELDGAGFTIDATGATRIFKITGKSVRISNLNIINGKYSDGGAIYWDGNLGTIQNCNFTNNRATHDGGAIYWNGYWGTIQNCNFTDNRASNDGGAVYFSSNYITFENCTFNKNEAYHGGAVSIKNRGIVRNCNFSNNKVKNGDGGAICFSNDGTVVNCNFINHTAYDWGGAIRMDTGSVADCNFTNNSAQNGGAIQFNTQGNVSNCNFANNKAGRFSSGSGGAIYFKGSGSVTLCNFYNNTAAEQGGAIFGFVSSSNSADSCIFKTDSDSTHGVIILSPVLNVDNFTSFYGSGEKLTFDLKTNSSVPIDDGNISISVFFKNNNSWVGNYSCLSGEGWIPDLPVGYYYAIFDTEYDEFQPINRTITVMPDNTFWALNYIINSNNDAVINLTNDYYFNPAYDTAFVGGIVINRLITIKGNGYTIDAKGQAIIFQTRNSGVVLENITFINGVSSTRGGAIGITSGNVTNCTFINNSAVYAGAIAMESGNLVNCNFINNSAIQSDLGGGAVFINGNGNVTNCTFIDNSAYKGVGGAVSFNKNSKGIVKDCNFINNFAHHDGGAVSFINGAVGTVVDCNFNANSADSTGALSFTNNAVGTVMNCNFTANSASSGGAVSFVSGAVGTVMDCNFNANSASSGGALFFSQQGNVSNCNFIGNNATVGSAISFYGTSLSNMVSNCIFLNNRANAKSLEVIKNDDNITITFTGENNLLNAIYSSMEVSFTNVTYWGAKGKTNTGNSTIKPSRSDRLAGQNITIGVVVNDILVFNGVNVTDENGAIVLGIKIEGNYYIRVCHDEDSYYTWAETILSNMTYYVNVTSKTTTNKTVNITAKSNIFNETMSGKLLFILPNNVNITANYAGNGTWWANYTFNEYGEIEVRALYVGLDNVTINNATLTINKVNSTLTINDNITFDYGGSGSTTVTFTNASGVNASVVGQPQAVVNVVNNTIIVSGLNPGSYILSVTTVVGDDYNPVTQTASITVNKIKTILTANSVTTVYNVNKYLTITLKDVYGNPLKGVDVGVNLNGVKYFTTDKNGQIKIPTKVVSPNKYDVKITFDGNAYYLKSSTSSKVVIKKATSKITAAKKTFKAKTKVKKYAVILKDTTNSPIINAKLTLKVKGKTFAAKTNYKGKAVFKITKLNKKGNYKAVIKFNGNKYYLKSAKNTKITVKVSKTTFKTVSQGSKDTKTVKKIQQALKDHGYYLSYKGHYLKVDGKYESCTVRSVMVFQKDHGLKVTGKVDEKTAKKLGII